MKAVRILLFLLIFSSSCSSQRLRHESEVENERLEHRAEWKQIEDSIRAEWLEVKHLLRLSDERRQVWIWPEGSFSFQLDSGFVGSASMLLVEEVERSVLVEKDSVMGRSDRVIQVDVGEERRELVREKQYENRQERITNSSKQKALFRIILIAILLKGTIAWFWRYFAQKGK